MAHNKFGCICDICGAISRNKNEFYRLKLPTYQSDINNSTQYLDYCFKCYKDLKIRLAEWYE